MATLAFDAAAYRDVLALHAQGLGFGDIAARTGLTYLQVRGILTPKLPATGGRLGFRGRTRQVRAHAAGGLTTAELAARCGVPESEILRSLAGVRRSRALPPEEKARRQAERAAATAAREAERVEARAERARERARRRWWGEEEPAEPWRHRDPEAFAEDLGGDQVDELEAIAAAELADVGPIVDREHEPWGGPVSPHADGAHPPRVLTPDVVARVLELRALGLSWPAIAERVGCHRMAIYHARRAGRLVAPPSPAPLEVAPAKVRAAPPATSDDDW